MGYRRNLTVCLMQMKYNRLIERNFMIYTSHRPYMVALSGPWRSVYARHLYIELKFHVDNEALMIQMATTATMILCAHFFRLLLYTIALVPFLCTTEHIQYPTIGITYKFIEPAISKQKYTQKTHTRIHSVTITTIQ